MANLSDLTSWAVPRISNLLPLPEDELRQVISYAATSPDLSNPSAIASHFSDLLGSSSECISFIEEFNRRRFPAAPSSSRQQQRQPNTRDDSDAPPKTNRNNRNKQKAPLNKLPPVRKVESPFSTSSDNLAGKVYKKEDLDDYMSTSKAKMTSNSNPTSKPTSQTPSRSTTPNPPTGQPKTSTTPSTTPSQKQPPQQGTLTSDLLNKKKTPKPKPTTVSIPANTTMRAPSSTISDVSSALRSLELQTNPTLSTTHTLPLSKRRCNCSGRKHDLLLAAPNCLHCGKIICIKEGLAPCTFCGHDLISSEDMEAMRSILRDEQSKEKMNAHNAGQRKTESTKTTAVYASKVNPSAGGVNHLLGPTPASASSSSSSSAAAALNSAMEQRDKLLGFQNSSAKRTKIIDQAADWETPDSGVNMWATPQERALQLREQQKKMRELEWENRDEWEKRSVVVSIDLKGKRFEKRMGAIDKPKFEVEEDKEEEDEVVQIEGTPSGGTFSKNPLLAKGLIKPVWKPATGVEDAGGDEIEPETVLGEWGKKLRSGWRVVQDDMADNEALILDGGRLGGETTNEEKGTETSCG